MRAVRATLASTLACALALACAERASERAGSPARPSAYEALYALSLDGEPLIFAGAERWIDRPEATELALRLEAARDADPRAIPDDARVVVQSDAWGLWSRVDALASSSAARARLSRAAASLVARLALPPRAPGAPVVHTILPASEGWRDLEPELPVMSHERLFGLRRLFAVRQTERPALSRAIYSTLVAIDAGGRPRETDVVGDLEVLGFDGDRLVSARLFELDRLRALERGAREALVEVRAASRVPSAGADGFLATFDPPAPLEALPCARCHDDAEAMSLPSSTLPLGERRRALLDQLVARVRASRSR